MAVGNPLALSRSAYGSMAARVMKDSMHNYWHAGQTEHHPAKSQGATEPAAQSGSWLEHRLAWLADLEEARLSPTSTIALSNAHRRYLDATANWHLRVAYRLDPGDAALYEILHYTVMAGAAGPELARDGAEKLAAQTIEHALSVRGGIAAALTGAGAAINLLNNDMVPESGVGPEVVLRHWEMLSNCLKRYRKSKAEAVVEGWWEGVPQVRRGELAAYAALVEKLASTIGRKLAATGVLRGQATTGL